MVYVSLCVTRPVPWGPELRRGLDPKGSGPRVITKYRVRQRREHGIHSAISRETDTVPYSVRLRNVGSDDGLRTNDVRNNRGPFSLATTRQHEPTYRGKTE